MKRCILASGNSKKIKELSAILGTFGLQVVPQGTLGILDAEETGTTFVENAIIKARHAAKLSGNIAISDDSGICVPALGGAPGVYSARYAGAHGDDALNNAKLLADLSGKENRIAHYVCVIAVMRHAEDPVPLVAQGIWTGEIINEPRGEHGFGYDPFFYLPNLGMTAAELAPDQKNRISHRAIALKQLEKMLIDEINPL